MENNFAVGGIPMYVFVVRVVIALIERHDDSDALGQYSGLFQALDNGVKESQFVIYPIEVLEKRPIDAREDLYCAAVLDEGGKVIIDFLKE